MTTEDQVTEKVPLLKRQLGGGSKKPKVESAPKTGKYNIPPRPQVNLMPPEVLQGRDTAVLKKRMIWVIAALILVCIAVYALAFLSRASAEGRHDDALAAADQLTAEKKKYSPVTQVLNSINKTKDSRTFALSTEVNWNAYIYSIQAVLPTGVTVETVNVAGISPGAELAPGQDELTRAGIAVISFTALSETLPDASAWIDALNSVPGLADANLQSSVLQDEDGTELYLVTSTVQVTEEALANRTFPDQEPVAEDESEDGDEG
ncbi:hypothetical protein [Demequina sp.]|uniref:hypothetical protein n=1 Tax=Demequina sp. TaxID=2050685 RepID=UPI003D127B05